MLLAPSRFKPFFLVDVRGPFLVLDYSNSDTGTTLLNALGVLKSLCGNG